MHHSRMIHVAQLVTRTNLAHQHFGLGAGGTRFAASVTFSRPVLEEDGMATEKAGFARSLAQAAGVGQGHHWVAARTGSLAKRKGKTVLIQ